MRISFVTGWIKVKGEGVRDHYSQWDQIFQLKEGTKSEVGSFERKLFFNIKMKKLDLILIFCSYVMAEHEKLKMLD